MKNVWKLFSMLCSVHLQFPPPSTIVFFFQQPKVDSKHILHVRLFLGSNSMDCSQLECSVSKVAKKIVSMLNDICTIWHFDHVHRHEYVNLRQILSCATHANILLCQNKQFCCLNWITDAFCAIFHANNLKWNKKHVFVFKEVVEKCRKTIQPRNKWSWNYVMNMIEFWEDISQFWRPENRSWLLCLLPKFFSSAQAFHIKLDLDNVFSLSKRSCYVPLRA